MDSGNFATSIRLAIAQQKSEVFHIFISLSYLFIYPKYIFYYLTSFYHKFFFLLRFPNLSFHLLLASSTLPTNRNALCFHFHKFHNNWSGNLEIISISNTSVLPLICRLSICLLLCFILSRLKAAISYPFLILFSVIFITFLSFTCHLNFVTKLDDFLISSH